VILRRLAEPGQLVTPGTPVFFFGAAGKGEVVRAGLADREIVRVTQDDPAEVEFDAFPGRRWTGRVTGLGSAAAPGAGTYEVEIRLDESVADAAASVGLASGLVADVTIRPRRTERARLIPIVALVEGDGDRATVWSLGPDHLPRRHTVRIAELDGNRVAVHAGLDGVDRVVTDGAAYLTESSRVRPATDR
jgi:multidrug efflux pump subunit AcrA (membrane-fusion protein)